MREGLGPECCCMAFLRENLKLISEEEYSDSYFSYVIDGGLEALHRETPYGVEITIEDSKGANTAVIGGIQAPFSELKSAGIGGKARNGVGQIGAKSIKAENTIWLWIRSIFKTVFSHIGGSERLQHTARQFFPYGCRWQKVFSKGLP